jgi:CheY-like chemotaxis protein
MPCILIAEDDLLFRHLVVRSLKPDGYDLLVASDAFEALSISNNYKDDIHLLITNVQMPGMDGHELARLIKTFRPKILAMIVSAQHEKDFPPMAVAYANVLLKPVQPADVAAKVRELLGAGGASDAVIRKS